MAVLCLDPLWQPPTKPDGTINAGGKLYTYDGVTNAARAVFTDTDGQNEHTNPIILDSAGMPPSPVFYTRGASYNLVLTDADDVEIDTNLSFEVPAEQETDPSTYFDVEFYWATTPSESQRIYALNIRHDVSFAANWGSSGGVEPETPPAEACVITIKINGSEVGTATCSTGGAWSLATSGGAAVDAVVGDILSFHAPADATTISDIGLTLVGTLV
jgi:hypothetical protein